MQPPQHAAVGRVFHFVKSHEIALFWVAFALVHLYYGASGAITDGGNGFGDVVGFYQWHAQYALDTGIWPVINEPFVYPAAALIIIMIPMVFGAGLYFIMWMVMVTALNAVAVMSIQRWKLSNASDLWLAWWWLAFIALLGPVALGRVDSVAVPLVILALTALWRHPTVSGILLAFAGWIKIWPIAIFGAVFVALKRRLWILLGAVSFSVVLVLVFMTLGATTSNILSFVTQQGSRSLQAESVFATPWLWIGMFGGQSRICYNHSLLTWEICAPGATDMGNLLNVLLALAVLIVVALGVIAVVRGAHWQHLLPPLAVGLVTALIVFNKVGSPQFMHWIAPAIMVAMFLDLERYRVLAPIGLAIAALTQIIFPLFYAQFRALTPVMVTVATVRNLLLVVLFILAIIWLTKLALNPVKEATRVIELGGDTNAD